MLVKGEKQFSLPNEVVTVKFIPRKKGMAAEVAANHVIAGGMLSKSTKTFYAPLKKKGGIANVLTNQEKEYLEKVTGLDLSVYGEFWETFCVKLYKEDANNIFYLNDPLGYISVRLLETIEEEVANSWTERNNKPTYMFAITRSNEVTDERNSKLDTKKEAFKAYARIEHDLEKLIAILKLVSNKTVSKNSALDWVQGEIENVIDTNPKSFLDVLQDSSFDTKVLFNKGIESKVIIKKGNRYSTIDGLELCENGEVASYDTAIRYLENDKNQDVRALIEAKINNA